MKEQLRALGYTEIQEIQTNNGVGYIGKIVGGRGSIIIPPNYKHTEGISMLVCGQGGTGNSLYGFKNSDYNNATGERINGPGLISNAQNGNFPTGTVVIAPDDLYNSHTSGTNLLNSTYRLLNNNGANIRNVGVVSFSNGGPGSMLSLGEFLELNPNRNINTKVVLCDTWNVDQVVGLYDKDQSKLNNTQLARVNAMNALKRNGTQIYSLNWTSPNVYNGHADNMVHVTRRMSNLGFNISFSNSSRMRHMAYVYDFFNSNGLNFMFGTGSLKLNSNYYSKFLKYDASGNIIGVSIKEDNHLSSLVAASTKYEYLKSLSGISPQSTKISSNLKYVYEQMNQLRNKIKNSSFLYSANKQVFSNSDSIPGCITKYIDMYYNVMGDLMDSLAKETEAVISIAEYYDDMDKDLSSETVELSFENQGNNNNNYINTSVNVANSQASSNSYVTSSQVSSNSYVTNLGSESKKESGKNVYSENYQSNDNSISLDNIPKIISKNREDGSKIVVSTMHDKITDLKYVYEFSNSLEAEKKLLLLKDEYGKLDYIEDVVLNGNNIEIIFKKSSYIDLDIDTIFNKYLGGN